MPDSNYIGRYLRAKSDLPIYIVTPQNSFSRFDTLKAGEVYPISIYSLMNVGSVTYARFKVTTDAGAPYPGANYTYIPFTAGSVYEPYQQPYIPPAAPTPAAEKVGEWIKGLFIIGALAYVLGNFVKSK